MRFLTFNLWHGLKPSGAVAFEALEPEGRRLLREQLQIDVIKAVGADVCFFQEVNPVGRRSQELSCALAKDAEYQPDLVGTKIFGFGLPLNLNSGLVTMASSTLGLKWVKAVSLSRPGTRWVRQWGSYQLSEERFALFCETMVPGWGRVLLVNTHLHHGLEPTPEFCSELDALAKNLELSPTLVSELKTRLAAGVARRRQELNEVLRTLSQLQGRYEVVVLAGDFNAQPESELFVKLRELGFSDAWADHYPKGGGLTFDCENNQANHVFQSQFPLSVKVEDLSFSPEVRDSLVAFLRRQETRPRRIDYIWYRGSSRMKVVNVELVGHPDAQGFAPSDHFGVCAELEIG